MPANCRMEVSSSADPCASDTLEPTSPSATPDSNSISATAACKFRLLDFEKQIFLDVMERDALTIFAKGLSYWRVVSCVLWVHADPAHLVLVLNASTADEQYLSRHLPLSSLPLLAHERERAYLSGGVMCVSTRVLVVDLLRGRVPVQRVSGVLVLRAHAVLESCQEAFALRLYRRDNKTGFIKAFSSSPLSFTYGYGHVERVMRALYVHELFLWPRFHGALAASLRARQADVRELRVPLSSAVGRLQRCLLDLLAYTVRQLKASDRHLDTQELTMENCLTGSFHKVLRSQLDDVWHNTGERTRRLVHDLNVLRQCALRLIHDDAVTFYAHVSQYRTAEYAANNSGWTLLDTAEELFQLARARVFNKAKELEPEPCGKWQCLTRLLAREIPQEARARGLAQPTALVLCRDARTAAQINALLTLGAPQLLLYTALRKQLPVTSVAARYRHLHVPDPEGENTVEVEEPEQSEYCLTVTQVPEDDDQLLERSVCEPAAAAEAATMAADSAAGATDSTTGADKDGSTELDRPRVIVLALKSAAQAGGDEHWLETTLERERPHYAILYQPHASAARALELYEARRESPTPLTVYLLLHDNTLEEQAYLTALAREKRAFELLIQTKSVMVVSRDEEGACEEAPPVSPGDSRRAGGQRRPADPPLVVVDTREFRSELPALLHRRGCRIEPLTLPIGDYVLAPDTCVERKSLSDLVGSLDSGRLHAQCTHMCRYYTRAILLVEFSQNRPFSLQATGEADADTLTKLQLLTIQFPRLKIVWSPSPYATAELFLELKAGRDNPDAAATLALQRGAGCAGEERYSVMPHALLRKLPGLAGPAAHRLMNKAPSLHALAAASKEQLRAWMENDAAANALHATLHARGRGEDGGGRPADHAPRRKYTPRYLRKKNLPNQ